MLTGMLEIDGFDVVRQAASGLGRLEVRIGLCKDFRAS